MKKTGLLLMMGFLIITPFSETSGATNNTVAVGTNVTDKIIYTHKDTGFRFPEQLREYKYYGITDCSGDGKNVAVQYSTSDGLGYLTLYVYPAPKGTMGPTICLDEKGKSMLSPLPNGVYLLSEGSDSYNAEYGRVIEEILAAHPGWTLDHTKTRLRAIPEQNGPVSYKSVFSGMSPDYPIYSEFLLYVSHGHFVKVRATYPVEYAMRYSWLTDQFPLIDVKDDQLATVELLRRDAEAGDIPSMYMMGMVYLEGRGIPRNPSAGIPFCRKAAEGGHIPAIATLGEMYLSGKVVEKDPVEAERLMRKAAEQGDVDSQCLLGVLYSSSDGFGQNFTEAAKWFRKAAEAGDVPAMGELGQLMLLTEVGKGKGEEAVDLVKKAADMKYPPAMTFLGYMYMEGIGLPQDADEGRKWLDLAAAEGDQGAAKLLDSIKIQLSE